MVSDDLFYVVDTVTGVKYEPGHPTVGEACLACADKQFEFEGCTGDRFQVEPGPAEGPWAYATVPQQPARR